VEKLGQDRIIILLR